MSDPSKHGLRATAIGPNCADPYNNSEGNAVTGDSRRGASRSSRDTAPHHGGHEPSGAESPVTMHGSTGPHASEAGIWEEENDDQGPIRPLTREEAQALLARNPTASPWRVVVIQAVVGVGVALVAGGFAGRMEVLWSALYGAAIVVVPGALMAHGMTRRLPGVSAGGLAAGFMAWEFAKIGLSVVMLSLANRIVQPLSWLALLAGLVICAKVYWLALWRRR